MRCPNCNQEIDNHSVTCPYCEKTLYNESNTTVFYPSTRKEDILDEVQLSYIRSFLNEEEWLATVYQPQKQIPSHIHKKPTIVPPKSKDDLFDLPFYNPLNSFDLEMDPKMPSLQHNEINPKKKMGLFIEASHTDLDDVNQILLENTQKIEKLSIAPLDEQDGLEQKNQKNKHKSDLKKDEVSLPSSKKDMDRKHVHLSLPDIENERSSSSHFRRGIFKIVHPISSQSESNQELLNKVVYDSGSVDRNDSNADGIMKGNKEDHLKESTSLLMDEEVKSPIQASDFDGKDIVSDVNMPKNKFKIKKELNQTPKKIELKETEKITLDKKYKKPIPTKKKEKNKIISEFTLDNDDFEEGFLKKEHIQEILKDGQLIEEKETEISTDKGVFKKNVTQETNSDGDTFEKIVMEETPTFKAENRRKLDPEATSKIVSINKKIKNKIEEDPESKKDSSPYDESLEEDYPTLNKVVSMSNDKQENTVRKASHRIVRKPVRETIKDDDLIDFTPKKFKKDGSFADKADTLYAVGNALSSAQRTTSKKPYQSFNYNLNLEELDDAITEEKPSYSKSKLTFTIIASVVLVAVLGTLLYYVFPLFGNTTGAHLTANEISGTFSDIKQANTTFTKNVLVSNDYTVKIENVSVYTSPKIEDTSKRVIFTYKVTNIGKTSLVPENILADHFSISELDDGNFKRLEATDLPNDSIFNDYKGVITEPISPEKSRDYKRSYLIGKNINTIKLSAYDEYGNAIASISYEINNLPKAGE